MIELIRSLIRTYLPFIVAFLVETFGPMLADIDVDNLPGGGITVVLGALYYFFPRLAEIKGHKNAGFLLGSRKTPSYGSPEDAVIAAEDAKLEYD